MKIYQKYLFISEMTWNLIFTKEPEKYEKVSAPYESKWFN